jgi:predicted naringenin-chalcone synthase
MVTNLLLESGFAASFQLNRLATHAMKRATVILVVKPQIAILVTTVALSSARFRFGDSSNGSALLADATMVVLILAVKPIAE